MWVKACLLLFLIELLAHLSWASRMETVEFRMPNVQPNTKDLYLCTAMEVDPSQPHYITGYTPHGSMMTAHHMLMYGCSTPGSDQLVWNCGEMAGGSSDYDSGPVCAQYSEEDVNRIIYAWAKDAPALELPKGVGFKIGGGNGINYLVLQVHYMHPMNHKDDSGVTIHSTTEPLEKQAGVLLAATSGGMDAHTTENFDVNCKIDEDVVLHPFAFRTHTHKHGNLVSGWRVRDNQWTLLGKRDPQKPQMFYDVADKNAEIHMNDNIVARCRMTNDGDEPVYIGSTATDEMCNFYLMYWVDGNDDISQTTCVSPGPPSYRLEEDPSLKNIPEDQMNKA